MRMIFRPVILKKYQVKRVIMTSDGVEPVKK